MLADLLEGSALPVSTRKVACEPLALMLTLN